MSLWGAPSQPIASSNTNVKATSSAGPIIKTGARVTGKEKALLAGCMATLPLHSLQIRQILANRREQLSVLSVLSVDAYARVVGQLARNFSNLYPTPQTVWIS